jgi:acid phosphatase
MQHLMKVRTIPILVILIGFRGPVAAQPADSAPAAHNKLDSVLWVQTAAEHDALYQQAYRTARGMLDRGLKDRKWTAALEQRPGYERLPPAVVLDIDETILDNSPEEAAVITRSAAPAAGLWEEWVRLERATALPGALAFTKYARSRNVEVIYVTNRDAQSKEATRNALAHAGFPLHEGLETLYSLGDQPGWDTDKGPRRAAIARRYRILLLIGDDLGDFLSAVRVSPEERRRMAASYADYWGERWILLPNPMYGSWAGSLYGYDNGLSASEQLRRKRQHLRPMK